MKPKLRWLQEYYECTREDIVEYRDAHDCGFVEAKLHLQPALAPVLQYFDEDTQDWVEVPTVNVSLGKRYE